MNIPMRGAVIGAGQDTDNDRAGKMSEFRLRNVARTPTENRQGLLLEGT
jgi:hypothetical protein